MDGNQPKQQNWGRNRPREEAALHLGISNTPPEKKGEAWESLVTATLGRGNKTIPGYEIKFFLNGAEVGSDSTDEDGNASLLVALKPGKNQVRAQVVRATTYRTVMIEIEVERPKERVLLRPLIRSCRDGKSHVFHVQVVDDHGKGYACKVQVSCPNEPCVIVDLNDLGMGNYRVTLKPKERSRTFEFTLVGTNLSTVAAAYAA